MVKLEKPDAVFSVGITGHRQLNDDITKKCAEVCRKLLLFVKQASHEVIKESKEFYNDKAIKLVLVSPLAEGADRIAANAAILEGYSLHSPLPFSPDIYKDDFSSTKSYDEFTGLLKKADKVFCIAETRDYEYYAYENTSDLVLFHSDLLLAIWDGTDSGLTNGTSGTIKKAVTLGIPVLWINSNNPEKVILLKDGFEYEEWHEILKANIQNQLIPSDYLPIKEVFGKDQEKFRVLLEKKSRATGESEKETGNSFKTEFLFFDTLAIYYKKWFSKAAFLRQALPFLATLSLAVGFYWGMGSKANFINVIGFLFQIIFMFLIIYLTTLNNRNHWHFKFMEYRVLAELFRQMDYLGEIGIVFQHQILHGFSDEGNSWTWWFYRAKVRMVGLPNKYLTTETIREIKSKIINQLMLQRNFQNKTAETNKRKGHFWELYGIRLYYLGLVFTSLRVLIHFLVNVFGISFWGINAPTLFNMFSLLIPAIATAFLGIGAQANYTRLNNRASIMSSKIQYLLKQSKSVNSSNFHKIREYAEQCAYAMLTEVEDWKHVIKGKGINKH